MALGWMLVITRAPMGRRWHVPATLGDHRGVIKAAVTVVNRAANKGSRGWRGRESKGGKEVRGGIMEDCLSFVLSLVCFAHCDLPVRQWVKWRRVHLGTKWTSPKFWYCAKQKSVADIFHDGLRKKRLVLFCNSISIHTCISNDVKRPFTLSSEELYKKTAPHRKNYSLNVQLLKRIKKKKPGIS